LETLGDHTLEYWHGRLFTCVSAETNNACTILALGSGIFVFPNHIMTDGKKELQFVGSKTNYFVQHNTQNIIYRDLARDLCYCQYDISGISNLKQNMLAEDRPKHSNARFYTASDNSEEFANGEVHYVRSAYDLAEVSKVNLTYSHKAKPIKSCGFFYKLDTRVGLCGSLLLTRNGKLIGIHAAGNGSEGFAQPFTGDMLTHVDSLRLSKFSEEPYVPANVTGQANRTLFAQADCFGKIQPPAFVPYETSIKPTIFNEHFEETQQPAILHTKDPRNVEKRNIICFNSQKMFSKQYVMDRNMQYLITQHLISYFQNVMSKHGREKFTDSTIDEAVSGMDAEGNKRLGYTSLNITSSNGYPFTGIQLFNRGEGNLPLPGPRLREEVDKMEQDIEKDKRPDAFFSLLLKDETRPLEKIKAGKTRTFMGSNKPFVVLSRKYLGDFVAFLHDNYIVTPSTVGIDATGNDWGLLYDDLIAMSDKAIEADFTNWDGSISFSLYRIAADVINALYDGKSDHKRDRILYEFANATFVCLGNAYRRVGGLPSGCFGTAEFNSLFNWIIHLYAFQRCIEDNKLDYGLYDFYEHVSLHVYGDDVIMTVSSELQPYFTPARVNDWLTEIGFTMTNGDKSALTDEFKDIHDCRFLKRDFHSTSDGIFGRLDISIIENSLRWTMAIEGEEKAVLQQQIDSALESLIGYGEDVYKSYVDKLRKIAPEYVYKDFSYYYSRWCSKQLTATSQLEVPACRTFYKRQMASRLTPGLVVTDNGSYTFFFGDQCGSNWKAVPIAGTLHVLIMPPCMPRRIAHALLKYYAGMKNDFATYFRYKDGIGLWEEEMPV
jgi:hypothetical protein